MMEITIEDAKKQENIVEKMIKFAEENEDKVELETYGKDVCLSIKKGRPNKILLVHGASYHRTRNLTYRAFNKMLSMDSSFIFVDNSYMHDCHDDYISIQLISTRRSRRD